MQKIKKVIYKDKIVYEGNKCWGLSWNDGVIELDKSLKGKGHLQILIHEIYHRLFPDLSEKEINKLSIHTADILWKEDYRRVDNNETKLK